MDSATHPLTARLSPDSALALTLWLVTYALNHPGTITPQGMERLARGDKYDRKARALLSLYGLGRPNGEKIRSTIDPDTPKN
jgi:hypothetical protein